MACGAGVGCCSSYIEDVLFKIDNRFTLKRKALLSKLAPVLAVVVAVMAMMTSAMAANITKDMVATAASATKKVASSVFSFLDLKRSFFRPALAFWL